MSDGVWSRGLSVSQKVVGTVLLLSMLASALLTYNEARLVFDADLPGFDEPTQAFTVLLATVGGLVLLVISARLGSRYALVVSLVSLVVLLFGGDFLQQNRETYVVVSLVSAAASAELVYTTRNRGG